ncbi:tripartite motif-containing protein 2 [Lingula anatina]|uniref:Tripartite motif-containing protein 2 n=1 Tax=Lingula anatina TaxID=7574 RepID=A0A1S3JJM5_LINAN|nr:tripartite motif-containing protein 2 [Lingula anatina]|eukprot:XP_013410331.1 tripartite motif-containing protein 2 [Lingula anatina]
MAACSELIIPDNLLTCSICLEEYRHPQILPCQHIFCLVCINTHGQNSKPDLNMTCPLCRTRVSFGDIRPLWKNIAFPRKCESLTVKLLQNDQQGIKNHGDYDCSNRSFHCLSMELPIFKEKSVLLHSFIAKLTDDTKKCCLTGMDANEQYLYIVDTKLDSSTGNQKIKIFSPQGHLRSSFALDDPTDVAILQDGNACVVNYSQKIIHNINTTKQQNVTRFGQQKFQVPYSVTRNRQGNIMVCDRKRRSIFIFNPHNGTFLSRISLPMCSTPVYCSSSPINDDILVSDYSCHCVYLLTPSGQNIFQYGIPGHPGADDGQLNSPCGVCFDNFGNIFIADTWNHRVVMVSPRGTLVKYIASEEDGITLPRTVVVLAETGKLAMAEQDGNIKIYQYLE